MNSTSSTARDLTGLIAVVAAALTLGAAAVGADHASEMPSTPWWLGAVAAAVAAAVAIWPRSSSARARRALAGVGLVAAAAMAVGAAFRLPHDLLVTIGWVVQQVTGADALFDVDPPWLMLLAQLAMLVAAIATARLALRDRRAAHGRRDRPRAAPRTGVLRAVGVVAALAPVPYAALKAAWGLGSRVGLTEPDLFEDVTFFTPGFGDTVLLACVGIGAAVAMAVPLRHRWVRRALGSVGVLGSAMLLPVGVLGGGMIGQVLLGVREFSDGGLALWVFGMVYGSFLVWGVALCALTWLYLASTRPADAREESGQPAALSLGADSGSPQR